MTPRRRVGATDRPLDTAHAALAAPIARGKPPPPVRAPTDIELLDPRSRQVAVHADMDDPWVARGVVHILRTRALTRSGRRAHALRQYLDCRRHLDDDLGIEPARETTELQQLILAGETVLRRGRLPRSQWQYCAAC